MKDLRNSDSSSSHICEVKLRINTVELLSQILQLYCCCTCCRALLSGLQLSFYFDLLILLLYFKLFLSNSDIVAEIGVLLLVKSVDYTTVHMVIPVDRRSCLMENTFFFAFEWTYVHPMFPQDPKHSQQQGPWRQETKKWQINCFSQTWIWSNRWETNIYGYTFTSDWK